MVEHPCTSGPGGKPCLRIRKGEAYDISTDCRPCWLFAHDAAFNLHWGGDGNVTHASRKIKRSPQANSVTRKISERLSIPCIHLGAETGERHDCLFCGGQKDQPISACALHGRCTWKRRLVYKGEAGALIEVKWCVACDDYQQIAAKDGT